MSKEQKEGWHRKCEAAGHGMRPQGEAGLSTRVGRKWVFYLGLDEGLIVGNERKRRIQDGSSGFALDGDAIDCTRKPG